MVKKINIHFYEMHTNLDLEGYEDMEKMVSLQELNFLTL